MQTKHSCKAIVNGVEDWGQIGFAIVFSNEIQATTFLDENKSKWHDARLVCFDGYLNAVFCPYD